ncbi:uncharacterized protein LOC130939705 [Arachis stenosperma]|uniref:uncharacterized protein LOC130939705 n=1 Tax=Arachis stenosperma TaxID=217475 RepID=UPI0025AD2A13|nr:uncharacterized protein LOC130939705 [Arachis stenosperma]
MIAPRPFAQWGVDLLGPFPPGPGQIKYLIVAIDYYTKWMEAESLASIFAANCQKFLWRQVITRFGIPESVISDNGTQFTDKKFREFLSGLGIKQTFSFVEHPQSNGQVEAANKVILKGLKKRLKGKKGPWADELASVLWSYRTPPIIYRQNSLLTHIRGRHSHPNRNRGAESEVTFRRRKRGS